MPVIGDVVQLKHPDPDKAAPRIERTKYEIVREVLLELIPGDEAGVPFDGLADQLAARLGPDGVASLGSPGWYTTSVKLDLEARGLIERVPGSKPQRLRLRQPTQSSAML